MTEDRSIAANVCASTKVFLPYSSPCVFLFFAMASHCGAISASIAPDVTCAVCENFFIFSTNWIN